MSGQPGLVICPGAAPPHPTELRGWLLGGAGGGKYDLYVVATQENASDEWHEMVAEVLGGSFVRVADRAMGQIRIAAFVRRIHAHAVSRVETSYVATGVLRIGRNKGAVALALHLHGVALCFVNAHLAAHQEKVLQRNQDTRLILKHLRLGGCPQLDVATQCTTVWCGDLNYRVGGFTRPEVLHMVAEGQLEELLAQEQLRIA